MLVKINAADTLEEKVKIANHYMDIIRQVDPDGYDSIISSTKNSAKLNMYGNTHIWYKITITDIRNPMGEPQQFIAEADTGTRLKISDALSVESIKKEGASNWDKADSDSERTVNRRYKVTYDVLGYGIYTGAAQTTTASGVTLSTYRLYSPDELKAEDFTKLTKTEAKDLYIHELWQRLRQHQQPSSET